MKYVLLMLCVSCTARGCTGTAQEIDPPGRFIPAPRQPVVIDKGMDLSPILPLPSPFHGPGPWGW